jgi:hypothetical protein
MPSIEINPPEHQPVENPLLGALLQVAGLVARHGLSARLLRVEDDGRYVRVDVRDGESLEEARALVDAWAQAIGVSRVSIGGPLHEGSGSERTWLRSVSASGRVGQLDVQVSGYGRVPAPEPVGFEAVAR